MLYDKEMVKKNGIITWKCLMFIQYIMKLVCDPCIGMGYFSPNINKNVLLLSRIVGIIVVNEYNFIFHLVNEFDCYILMIVLILIIIILKIIYNAGKRSTVQILLHI